MNLLLLGSKGMLGSEFTRILKSTDEEFIGLDIQDLDLTDREKVYEKITCLKPRIIINCAAFTDVDACESQKEKAFMLNEKVPYTLAEICKIIDACLIHFSTDFIFNGKKIEPYTEDDKADPINVYGYSKLKGENVIREILNKYFIVRTEWLYGKNGKNFIDMVIKLAKEQKYLEIVDDQVGSPTYAKDLAEIVLKLAGTTKYGFYNITNSGQCSRFEWAEEIIKFRNIEIEITPVKSTHFKVPALRPPYSVLSNEKFNSLGLGLMRGWRPALKDYIIGS